MLPWVDRNTHAGERVYVRDRSGNVIDDVSLHNAAGLRFGSFWPKGYGPASFSVHRDVARRWAVKNAYDVVVRDGPSFICYQGRINDPALILNGTSQTITVPMSGYYVVLTERLLRKRWVDNAAIDRLIVPSSLVDAVGQNQFVVTREDDYFLVQCGYGDVSRVSGEGHYRRYTMPTGIKIRRVETAYAIRSGEGVRIDILNVDNGSAVETFVATTTGSVVSGNISHNLTAGDTERLDFRFYCTDTDLYDDNDWMRLRALLIYGKMDNFPSPTYTGDEIIKDALYLKAGDLSSNYDRIASPAVALVPFTTRDDGFETLDSIIQRIGAFGDSSQQYYGGSVWSEFGTTDGKPRFVFEPQPGTADNEWQVSLAELAAFNLSESDEELYNWIPVKFTDADGRETYLTPDDDASLKDTTSIALYGERAPRQSLNAGQCDAGSALDYGKRFLAGHKLPLWKGDFSIRGGVRDKVGVRRRGSRVQGGHRVTITDYRGGTTFMLRHTTYEADTMMLRMEPSLPADSLSVWQVQRDGLRL
jgi:hypothetical protein